MPPLIIDAKNSPTSHLVLYIAEFSEYSIPLEIAPIPIDSPNAVAVEIPNENPMPAAVKPAPIPSAKEINFRIKLKID